MSDETQKVEITTDDDVKPPQKRSVAKTIMIVCIGVFVAVCAIVYFKGKEAKSAPAAPVSNVPEGNKIQGPLGAQPNPEMASMIAEADRQEAKERYEKGLSAAPRATVTFEGEAAPEEAPASAPVKRPLTTEEGVNRQPGTQVQTAQAGADPVFMAYLKTDATRKSGQASQQASESARIVVNTMSIADYAAAKQAKTAEEFEKITGKQMLATTGAGQSPSVASRTQQPKEPDLISSGEEWIAQLTTAHSTKLANGLGRIEVLSPSRWAGATGTVNVSPVNGYLVAELSTISKGGRTWDVKGYLFDERTNMAAMADEVKNYGLTRSFLRATIGAAEAAGNLAAKSGTTTNIIINPDGTKSETQSTKDVRGKDYAIAAAGGAAGEIKTGLTQEIERTFQDESWTRKDKVVRVIFSMPVKASSAK